MRLPLIDGQGNFGSVDGDNPGGLPLHRMPAGQDRPWSCCATSTRTRSTSSPITTIRSASRWCCRRGYPNLLVNGAGGIAVGMATNIPPHNLGEVIDACIALIDNPALSIDDLIAIVPGPDFPTGGLILGRQGIRAAYHLGRGSIVMRGKVEFEDDARGPRGDHRLRDSLPGEQGQHGRAHRRTGARQEDRRHLGAARRVRPRRLPGGDRTAPRRRAGRGAQPALSLHRAAIDVRRQHAWRSRAAGRR